MKVKIQLTRSVSMLGNPVFQRVPNIETGAAAAGSFRRGISRGSTPRLLGINSANIFAGGWGIEPHTALQQRPPDVTVCNVLVTNKHVYVNSRHACCNKNIPALIKLFGT